MDLKTNLAPPAVKWRASRTGGSRFFILRVFAASEERSRLAIGLKTVRACLSRAEATVYGDVALAGTVLCASTRGCALGRNLGEKWNATIRKSRSDLTLDTSPNLASIEAGASSSLGPIHYTQLSSTLRVFDTLRCAPSKASVIVV